MRNKLIFLVAVLLLIVVHSVDLSTNAASDIYASSYQQITSLSSSTALTVPAGATGCVIQAEAQNLRLATVGTTPEATVGVRIFAGKCFYNSDGKIPLGDIRLIEEGSGGIANVIYTR